MRRIFIVALSFFPFYYTTGQNCMNAGLETGDLSGYTSYHGKITQEGKVIIDTPGPGTNQHRVMHISEGFDPVALSNCLENDSLPLVPEGGGQYTLRLGNAQSGAKAERVVLSFTVTEELSFFLLRYAVILNDPEHEPFEQPRFELRILDEGGDLFPCGEYQVRAAANIPGFESCAGGWRVRPWTTVGFELQSFLGENIQIEILTTDCAQGGHAGYAYLDISCQPLDIKLEGYCPETTDAIMRVTDGFIDYKWSTGEKTSAITIPNPMAGTAYQVTVTSATGCTLVLSDTIPAREVIPPPEFFPEADRTYCRDTMLWFHPKGKHLKNIYSPTLGLAADSFLLSSYAATAYTFVSSDPFGCAEDTLEFRLDIAPPLIQSIVDSVACFGDNNGAIALNVVSDFPPVRYSWNNGTSENQLADLPPGEYTVTIVDQISCTNTARYLLNEPPILELDILPLNPITCFGEKEGSIEIVASGGRQPYQMQLGTKRLSDPIISRLSAGEYRIFVEDYSNCMAEQTFSLTQPPELHIASETQSVSCYGLSDGSLQLFLSGGSPGYYVSWNDARYDGETAMQSISAGTYTAIVTDIQGCSKEQEVVVHQPPFDKDCGTFIPNIFSPNGDGLNDIFFVSGSKTAISLEKFEIYDRWGELVFEKPDNCTRIGDPQCGWKGNLGPDIAPVGVYLYQLGLRFPDQNLPVIYTGDVQLLR